MTGDGFCPLQHQGMARQTAICFFLLSSIAVGITDLRLVEESVLTQGIVAGSGHIAVYKGTGPHQFERVGY
ncbi:hypothetical protein CH330_07620 [candidate division WOR-3 bacterium JGI_Cruoil_03_51_56]|uniref:Uncharacterized protein n=1 Tax=candidate division WOR-3 bacterium JGI_Cruoil_03_51_56 TaxID=1973747 RepID=A0A235BQK6_UNCW3|nr:MAG: hypothetical protein CH330_07620 [candidate division WOR-3 bacterium JGI_Cruoil_03_51_56]